MHTETFVTPIYSCLWNVISLTRHRTVIMVGSPSNGPNVFIEFPVILSQLLVSLRSSYWIYQLLGIVAKVCTNPCGQNTGSMLSRSQVFSQRDRCSPKSYIPWYKSIRWSWLFSKRCCGIYVVISQVVMVSLCVAH